MVSTPQKLIKLKPFNQRICDEVYDRHPALTMTCFEKLPFRRSIYVVRCLVCDQMRMVSEAVLKQIVDTYRATGKLGFIRGTDEP